MAKISDRVRRDYDELPTHPHILDLARRVYPIWVAANGTRHDRGVDDLAREIAQCVAAAHHLQDEVGADAGRRYVSGNGIVVTVPLQFGGATDNNFDVAVVAGTAYGVRLALGGV